MATYSEDKINAEQQHDDDDNTTDSSSSEEDEDGQAITEQFEKDWICTLAALKAKDPKIYDKNVNFFQNTGEGLSGKKSKKKKTLTLQDVQRKTLITTEGAPPGDEKIRYEDDIDTPVAPSYFEEQQQLKKQFHEAASAIDNQEEDILIKKTNENTESEREEDYRLFLKGRTDELKKSNKITNQLSVLKDFWSKSDLTEGETFLRDYILNKGYKSKNVTPSYMEIIKDEEFSEEEEMLTKQDRFEREYNFRFEEPDRNFIKSHPRKIIDSVRREDTSRAEKRKVTIERKKKEKEMKQEKLKSAKKQKRKEILSLIAKLKQVSGNNKLGAEPIDLDGDFNPDLYDKFMESAFCDDYYAQGDEDNEKPVFSDDGWGEEDYNDEPRGDGDDYGDGEGNDYGGANYGGDGDDQDYDGGGGGGGGDYDDGSGGGGGGGDSEKPGCSYQYDNELHFEDPDFNMDADYDPSQQQQQPRKKRKDRKKKQKQEKPKFNPDEMSFEEYFDEYYKLDYEDLIDDLPCRYQYRSVVPNDFGLDTEEILHSTDKELNSWCPLSKVVQYRNDDEEFVSKRMYFKRSKQKNRKKNVLTTYYTQSESSGKNQDIGDKRKEKKNRPMKGNIQSTDGEGTSVNNKQSKKTKIINQSDESLKPVTIQSNSEASSENSKQSKKSRNKKRKLSIDEGLQTPSSCQSNKQVSSVNNNNSSKQSKNKKQKLSREPLENQDTDSGKVKKAVNKGKDTDSGNVDKTAVNKGKDNKSKDKFSSTSESKSKVKTLKGSHSADNARKDSNISNTQMKKKKRAERWKQKQQGTKHNKQLNVTLSNSRLKAYGINPTKFKYITLPEHK
ncbi:hypothetical protein Ahia01_000819400 [Argonauta hians]